MDIPQIVLTGGPGGGKTTAQAFLREKLCEIGFYPLFVPEAATILINAGVTPVGGVYSLRVFQEHVIDLTLRLEDEFVRGAKHLGHPKPVVVCDRGLMDPKAYMPEDMFWEVTRERGLDLSNMRDARYLGVFHLRTAALGAEEFYTLANNTARRETVEEARAVDEATLQAWVGHPHVAVIDNEGKTFDQKLHHLFAKVCRVLGVPVPLEIERKFLVKPVDMLKVGNYQTAEIEQVYVNSGDVVIPEMRLRRRGQSGVYTYYETKKRELRPGVRVETERFITEEAYRLLRGYQLPGTGVLTKSRHNFVYKDQYFELDEFVSNTKLGGSWLLEIELTEENDKVELPPWINVIEDVTALHAYSNRALAEV